AATHSNRLAATGNVAGFARNSRLPLCPASGDTTHRQKNPTHRPACPFPNPPTPPARSRLETRPDTPLVRHLETETWNRPRYLPAPSWLYSLFRYRPTAACAPECSVAA